MVWVEMDEREGSLVCPVMTEKQIEILRPQIIQYAIICDQLLEMYKSFIIAQQYFFGLGQGNLYCDPLMASGVPRSP
ncbi:hypothetical protein QJS04_geneDACA011487 [Acorus gramineus]|uniref:Uncharacterized protein n=1 Tax=Acorus gramineus TaxID=55184 RepID=A0AAV9A2Z5_ACOGR|nr:hypothetical protein QJS04_geneDACA011487 [Acorus gramineus]